jgi:hypothetical protein
MKRERKRTTQTRVTEESQRMVDKDKEMVLNMEEGKSTDR